MRARSPLLILLLAASVPPTRAQAQRFTAVYVAAPGDIWATAANGTLVHGGSGSWIKVPTSTDDDLHAVAGSSPRDVWAGGEHGFLIHWNGTALTAMRASVAGDVVALSVCSPTEAWAVLQSENDRMPPALLHWNGSAWTSQRMAFAFRVANVTGSCPNLAMVGTTFFDPKPTEVHQVGVLARLQGGNWTTSGWNGRSVDDQDIGGTGWTGIAAGTGGTLLLRGGPGNSVLMTGRPGAWTRLQPPGEFETAILAGDTPVLIRKDGFSRFTLGSWHDVGQSQPVTPGAMSGMSMGGGQPDTAKLRILSARAESIQATVPRGQQPNGQQMQALMALSMQMAQASGMPAGPMSPQQVQAMQQAAQQQQQQMQQMQAQGARNQTLNFGQYPVTFAAGSSFYVATQAGGIMHVSGDNSRVVFEQACLFAAAAQYSDSCKAEPGVPAAPPLVAPRAPAAPGPEAAEEAPPSEPQQPSRPRIGLPRPRIRIP